MHQQYKDLSEQEELEIVNRVEKIEKEWIEAGWQTISHEEVWQKLDSLE